MIEAPYGDHCPICRCSLFRPPFSVGVGRALIDRLQRLTDISMFATRKMAVFWRQLSDWITLLIILAFYMDNVYYYVALFLRHFTDVRARNPDLELDTTIQFFAIFHSNVFGKFPLDRLVTWWNTALLTALQHTWNC
jgi:hypothetical protein